jgi:hypothetical protein
MTIQRLPTSLRGCVAAALLLAAVTGCGQDAAPEEGPPTTVGARDVGTDDEGAEGGATAGKEPVAEETGADSGADQDSDPGAAEDGTDGPQAPAVFDPASVPVSDAPPGEFPYLAIPEGYENPNRAKPILADAHAPFWTGDQLLWVEGTVYQSLIHSVRGREFSRMELQGFIEDTVTELGGVRVTDSQIPTDVVYAIDEEITSEYNAGLGDVYNDRVKTYVIRTAASTIWIHFSSSSASAGWIIAETDTEPTTEMP